MTEALEQALARARARVSEVSGADLHIRILAFDAVTRAERALASARGEPYATVLDLGVRWDAGAPMPHLISNGGTAVVVCYAADATPGWDGTFTSVVSADVSGVLVIRFEVCAAVRFGAPNDEALVGHPLDSRGLTGYHAHEVHQSDWLAEHIRINSAHDGHSDERWRGYHHYFLVFHDDMFEALAEEISARVVHGTMGDVLQVELSALVADSTAG